MNSSIGERIATLRELRRLTARQLARLSGVSHSHICRIEAGYTSPSYITLQKIARALDVDVKEFTGEPEPPKPSLRQIAYKLLDLAESSGLRSLPLRGDISAGIPLTEEERVGEYIQVPEELISGTREAYALRVHGESLSIYGVHDGDNIVVDPHAPFVPGKIYAVKMGNEVVVMHLNEKGSTIEDLEVLGRVIAYGNWNKL